MHCLGAIAAVTIMMGQRVVMLRQSIGTKPLDGLRDAFMQDPPPLQHHSVVGYFLREDMLESVCQFGNQAGLIEFRCLQVL